VNEVPLSPTLVTVVGREQGIAECGKKFSRGHESTPATEGLTTFKLKKSGLEKPDELRSLR
jgi:hypothetical protein